MLQSFPERRHPERGAGAGVVVLAITAMMLVFITAITMAVYFSPQAAR